jgi:protein-disulfide isomerase
MTHLASAVRPQDHVLGPKNAAVTLVEYGDFECPYCGRAYGILKELQEDLGPQLRLVYRHFPLTTIHPHAEDAALASEAADEQGKFWEMHDLLFENQNALEVEDLENYARTLGLAETRLEEILRARTLLPRIKEDFLSGVRSGVNGTPTFFINGARHNGSFEYPVLIRAIQQAAEVRLAR